MSSFSDIIKFVLKNMNEKKKRVFLTISGIILGIFTFTFFIFAAQGLENAIVEQFSSFGLNVLGVSLVNSGMGGGPPGGGEMTDTDLERIKQAVSGYTYIAPAIFMSDKFYEYSREKAIIVSLAYPDEYLDIILTEIGIEIENGRKLRSGDSSVAIIGAKTAEIFDKDKPLKIGSRLEIEGKKIRIIGIIKERGDLFIDNSLIMPFEDIKKISGTNTYSMIRISYPENANLEEQREAILRKMNPNGKEKRVNVSSPKDAIERFQMILGALTLIISMVSLIALIVGGINVMNTMYSNILERINEISVIKALGGTNSDIRNIFLIESSLLGLIGSLLGFFLAYGLAKILSIVILNLFGYNIPIYFQEDIFLTIVLFTIIGTTIFGTYPAIKASMINPADNLRDD